MGIPVAANSVLRLFFPEHCHGKIRCNRPETDRNDTNTQCQKISA
jgi:hypothetical protein